VVSIIICRADWDIGTKIEDDLKDNLRKISGFVEIDEAATVSSKSLLSKEQQLQADGFAVKEF